MNDFDKAARFAAKIDPAGFLAWLVPELVDSFAFRHWLDTRTLPFHGAEDRTCDTVARFDPIGRSEEPLALVTEFQTEPDANMLDRLLEYAARARCELRWGRDKFRVAVALVNLTGKPQPDQLDMRLPGAERVGNWMGVRQRTLQDEDATDTLAAIAAGRLARCLLPWIPLMRGGGDPAIMAQWRRLAKKERNRRRRADYVGLTLIFAELTQHKAEWENVLEGLNVKRSETVMGWEAEGELKAMRKTLLRALELRFQEHVPTTLVRTIKKMADQDQLSRWFDAAVTADSLEDFRAAIEA
jgi:hypothetical protein